MIKPKVKTRVNDGLLVALKGNMKQARGAYTTVGVHSGAGNYPDGTPVAMVAIYNEFGTGSIPERSFMRSTVNENMPNIKKWTGEVMAHVQAGQWTVAKAMNALGLRMQIQVQNKIKSNVPPPNAPETVARKAGRGVAPSTLIDTTLLLRSIGYEVQVPNA